MSKLLERRTERVGLTSTQYLFDSLWLEIPQELSNPRHLIPILAGGLAYHWARLSSIQMGLSWMPAASGLVRAKAFIVGVGAEAFTYEKLHRFMMNSAPQSHFGQAWTFSSLQFGFLRSMTMAFPSQNWILRHFVQDASVLLSQDFATWRGWTPSTSENLIQRFVHTEISNLQILCGLQTFHKIFPQWSSRERAWDLVAQTKFQASKSPAMEASVSLASMASRNYFPEEVISRLQNALPEEAKAEFRDLKTIEEKFASVLGKEKVSPKISNGLKKDFDQLRNASHECSFALEAAIHRLSNLSSHLYLSEKYGVAALFLQHLKLYEGQVQSGDHNGSYWYHPSSELPLPPRTLYERESRAWIDQLELQLKRRGEALELDGEISAHKYTVDPNLVNRVWIVQLLNFATQIKARVTLQDAQVLLEPFRPRERRPDGSLLNRALSEMEKENLGPEARQVFELIIPYSEIVFGNYHSNSIRVNLSWILGGIESVLNHQVRIVFHEQDSQLVLRVMSPSLFEKLIQLRFEKGTRGFYYVPGEISTKAVIQLREQGMGPVGFVRNPLILNDVAAYVPAWIFPFHDIFHATVLATYPDALRRFSGKVFRAAQSEAFGADQVGREHFRRLIDFDSDPENFFAHTLSYLSKSSTTKIVKTKNASPVLGDRLRFINAYEIFLKTKIEPSPERDALLRELGKAAEPLRKSEAKNRWLRLFGYQIHYPVDSER